MNSSRIFRSLATNERLLRQLCQVSIVRRTFLSEAYQCQEAWNKRLESPLLQKIKPIDFFLELDQKYQSKKRISAVDVDIFANTIQDSSHIDELADLLHKLRMIVDTTYTLDSTHHAVVRYYINVGEAKQLLEILNDRLNYGVFCDYFCYNLLMDHFIKKQDFASAAKVASFLMLQEEFEHPISNSLAIYSCHKYLENPDTWQEEDPEVVRLRNEPKEEVKVRVRYLRNPYFDEHFDLWKPSDLVGKTLFWIGQTMNDSIGRSCHLRGLALFRKYADAIALLKKWKQEGTEKVVYKDILSLIKKDVPEIFNEQTNEENANVEIQELRQLLNDLENSDLQQDSFTESIENLIKKAVEAHSEDDISRQIKLYGEWEKERMEKLQKDLEELDKENRLKEIEKIKKDLVERERILTFFENEEKIELMIEEKLQKQKEMYEKDEKIVKEIEETYVPPEIVKKRQNQ